MARIPDVTDFGSRPIPTSRRPIISDQTGEIRASGVQALGSGLEQIGNVLLQKQDRLEYANAQSKILQADIAARHTLEQDNNWQTYEQRYKDIMSAARSEASNLIQSNSLRQQFDAQANTDIARGVGDIQTVARKKQGDEVVANLNNSLVSNREAYLLASRPEARAAILNNSNEQITAAHDAGWISATSAQNLRTKVAQDSVEAYASILSPSDRLKYLEDPTNPAAAMIPLDKRVALAKQASDEMWQNEVRHQQVIDAQQKAAMKATQDQGLQLLSDGKLTMDWINQNAANLGTTNYRWFESELTRPPAQTDPVVYDSLYQAAMRGDEDVQDRISTAFRARQISAANYNSLQNVMSGGLGDIHKRGYNMLNEALHQSEINPSVNLGIKRAEVFNYWDNWISAHPKAAWPEAEKEVKSLISSSLIVDPSAFTELSVRPRYLKRAQGPVTMDQINSAKAATQKAYDDKQIDQFEFEAEKKRLYDWTQFVNQRDHAKTVIDLK